MRPMRNRLGGWRTIVAPAALVFMAAPALAAPGFLRPAAGDRLESGTVVELLWNLDGVSSDAQESELVLSLDGGRTFPIRLTADFEPATRKVLWRVPALPTDQARLALRAGNDEEPAQETLAAHQPCIRDFWFRPGLHPRRALRRRLRMADAGSPRDRPRALERYRSPRCLIRADSRRPRPRRDRP